MPTRLGSKLSSWLHWRHIQRLMHDFRPSCTGCSLAPINDSAGTKVGRAEVRIKGRGSSQQLDHLMTLQKDAALIQRIHDGLLTPGLLCKVLQKRFTQWPGTPEQVSKVAKVC